MVMIPKFGQSRAMAQRAYRQVDAQTASPGQILLRLYDGAIRFTRQAQAAIEAGKPAEKGVYIHRTMAIIDELITALDHEAAPELCGNLERLYLYLIDQLTLANMRMDPGPCGEVIEHLTALQSAWEQAARETGG